MCAGASGNYGVLLCSGLIVVGVGGNGLVCLAVSTERRLQNTTNYFLLSLAVVDLLVSLLVMPLCILLELNQGITLPPPSLLPPTLLPALPCPTQ